MKIFYKFFYVFISITVIFYSNNILKAQSILDPNAKVETIASSIGQPEGPAWKDGVGLLFSDIKNAKIYQWTSGNSSTFFMAHSDSTNGLTYDLQGRLIAAQMGKRRIVRFEEDCTQTDLASTYNGKKFNSPNDLVVKSDGSIFFTDPDFNIPVGGKSEILINGKYIKGIYRISPLGNIQLLDGTFDKPNGICFSPDEKKLYVNESLKRKIYVWDVVDDTSIANKEEFATIPATGWVDGMKTDTYGNVYCAGPKGVWVYTPGGKYIGLISLPNNASASNCTWGETDGKTLFITSGTSVYKIRPLLTDVKKEGSILPKAFKLNQNFPNPFNPETTISYEIAKAGNVTLKVYDSLANEVAVLVDNFRQQGNYQTAFQAPNSDLCSGVYFYKLSSGNYSFTKKMIYLK